MGRSFRLNTRKQKEKTIRKRNRPSLKVLELEHYFIKYYDNDDFGKMIVDEMVKYENLKEIYPIMGRFGWYYDRKSDISWVESEYGSYLYASSVEFRNHLKFIDKKEHVLPKKVMKAIDVLRRYGIKIKKLEDMYFDSKHAREVNEIYYATTKFMTD